MAMTEPPEFPEHRIREIAAEKAHAALRPEMQSRRGRVFERTLPWVAVACVLALAAGFAWALLVARSAQSGERQLAQQVIGLGGTPVAGPAGTSGAAGAQGSRGPGPTDRQVTVAVDVYCAEHDGCKGVPSKAEVKAAVEAYCAAGVCRGKTGRSGQPGRSGASGASGQAGVNGAQGSPGPAPTDDQVRAAVDVYCAAHDDCTGPAGPQGSQGPTGPSGAAGRGIESIDCTGLGVDQLVITYTDGTSQTVPCALGNPSPTGAPTP
jgi:hypothetical protein